MLGTFRYCTHVKNLNHATLAFNNNGLGQVIVGLASRLNYSQDKGTGCCKDVAQTTGKNVETWPKSDPPPAAWRIECPQDPQPANYDPYRIKVPDVVVPPLPPSNAKRTGVVYATPDQRGQGQDSGYNQQQNQQGYSHQQGDQQVAGEEETKDSSFLGLLKGFFGKFRGRQGKGDSDAMMNDNREYQWLHL